MIFQDSVLKFSPNSELKLWLFLFFEIHAKRIDAIADAALIFGAVRKTVPQVPAAFAAEDFFADHEVAVIHIHIDCFRPYGFGKTWPTAAAVVLFGGMKNLISASFALVDSGVFV